ncbi:MAG: hypothetical protein QM597_07900 [Aeromicrobium sp.]|uniref:hypothetical protein n=1 Tax=Aeromicrobium sp. TaxID=1871063 RepID=UPI0039E23FBC
MRHTHAGIGGLLLTTSLAWGSCGSGESEPASPPPSEATTAPTPSPEPTAAGMPATAADLVGTWRDDDADWTVHFQGDGTFTWDYQGVTDFLSGTYALADGVVTMAGLDGNDLVGQVTEAGLVFTLGTLTRR